MFERKKFYAHGGCIFRVSEGFPDGCYLETEVARRLLPLFEAHDEPRFIALAADLREALTEAATQQEEMAA